MPESRGLGRRDVLCITAVAGVSAVLGGGLVEALLRDHRLHRVRRTRTQMGTLVALTVVHADPGEADVMLRRSFAEMERLEAILSRHRPDSALGRLNSEGRLVLAPTELVTVLTEALRLAAATNGAFDPTVLPLLDLYASSFADTGGPPAKATIDRALRLVRHEDVVVEDAVVTLARPGMRVTLDGIAKGYIVDQCVRLLASMGAQRVLVDAGGDIRTSVDPSDREPWTVAVQDPHDARRHDGLVRMGDGALATSADNQNTFTVDGSVHHILDPRTGRSPDETSSVSVVAPTAMAADGLSTALMVLGPEAGLAHLEAHPQAEGMMVTKAGRRLITPGFPASLVVLALLWLTAFAGPTSAEGQAAEEWQPVEARRPVATTAADAVPLFASHELLSIVLAADFTALETDRSTSPDRPGTLSVDVEGRRRDIPVEIRTRGAFRLDPANCSFPPLRIDVDEAPEAVGTPFEGQDDLKFVSSCRPERASWEALVLREYLAYRTVGVVSDESFRVRLLEASFVDLGADSRASEPRFAFVIEDEDALARRLDSTVFELAEGRNLPATAFLPLSRMTNAVAQYMVANPDWSGVAGHNVEILERGGAALAIPYDFDFSGLVNAPYAVAPPEYQLDSVRERYYRGWCENPLITKDVLDRFSAARTSVLDLWIGDARLPDDVRSDAVDFLNDFFDALETDERAHRRFLRDCRPLPG